MKKFLMTVGVLLCILAVLISCAPEPAVAFENFMNDLDIEGRFSDNAAEIERGKSSDHIVTSINALIDDLKSMTLDNATARQITAEFISASGILLEAAQTKSLEKLEEARKKFQTALKKGYNFTKKQKSSELQQLGTEN